MIWASWEKGEVGLKQCCKEAPAENCHLGWQVQNRGCAVTKIEQRMKVFVLLSD